MSDNGSCFTDPSASRRRGNAYKAAVRAAWASPTSASRSAGHRQTCGKIERFHQTTQKMVANRNRWPHPNPNSKPSSTGSSATTTTRRPHRALHGDTPQERWTASPPATPGPPIARAPYATLNKVTRDNTINWGNHRISDRPRPSRPTPPRHRPRPTTSPPSDPTALIPPPHTRPHATQLPTHRQAHPGRRPHN